MSNQTPRVIKSGDVMLAGRRPVGNGAECVSARPSQAAARIVDQDASGATLEVVCACGKRSYVRCNYRRTGMLQAPTPQAVRPAATSENQENQR